MSSALLASSELRVLLGTLAKAALSGAKTVMALALSRVSTKPGFFHRRNQGGKDRVIAGRHGHRGSGHTGEAAGAALGHRTAKSGAEVRSGARACP